MIIKIDKLKQTLLKVLSKYYPRDSAQKIVEVVLFGELSGHKSHGIIRVIDGDCSVIRQNPQDEPKIKMVTSISRLIDGNSNSAMLVANLATEEAIKIACKHKIALIGTNKTHSTSGCLSYFLYKITRNNLIGIIAAKSSDRAIHFGGRERLYGSNPLAIGIPSVKDPILLDMSTTAISWGEILKARRTGESLPLNVAIDDQGNFTQDSQKAYALVPFDRSYKGSGLAMVVEVLAGILTGSGFVNLNRENKWGILFLVISPTLLMDTDEFKGKVLQLVQQVKNSASVDGKTLRIPGERTLDTYREKLKSGLIDIDDKIWHDLQSLTQH